MNMIKKICPICALVSLTWIMMFAMKVSGHVVSNELLAMLMGGSVVGISYVLGTRMQTQHPKLWKLIAIPLGFAAMYALLSFAWLYAAFAVAAYAGTWFVFRNIAMATPDTHRINDITKALDNCCD
jgi:hypothetical protein